MRLIPFTWRIIALFWVFSPLLCLAPIASGQQSQRIGDFPEFNTRPLVPREASTQSVPAPSGPVHSFAVEPPVSNGAVKSTTSESTDPINHLSMEVGPLAAPEVQRASAASELGGSTLTLSMIEARKSELQDLPGLSPELRQLVLDQYAKASERLTEASHLVAQTESLRAESAGAAQEIERLHSAAQRPDSIALLPADGNDWSADEIRTALRSAEAGLNECRTRLQSVSAEIERRSTRLRELPDLMSQSRQKFEDVTKQLAGPAPQGEAPEMTPARRCRLVAALHLRQRELDFLQQESRTYAETTRLASLRRDAADRAVKSAQRQLSHLQRVLADREKTDAEMQAANARRAAATAHPTVREAARINSELAEANSELVAQQEAMRNDLSKAEIASEDLSVQYSETRKSAEAAKYSQAIGFMLRSQQAELPDTEYYRDRDRRRQKEQSLINLRLLEWENERRKILDTEAVVDRNLKSVSDGLGLIEQVDVRAELQAVFTARLNLYADLISNGKDHLGTLTALGAVEERLAKVIDEQSAFISEHILWVRSTAPLAPSLASPMATALADLIAIKTWSSVWAHLKSDIKTHPIFELLIIPALWLLIIRRKLHNHLESLAQDAQRSSATGMTPTVHATALTLLLAIPVPSLIALLGWRLTSVAPPGEFAFALGRAALISAGALCVVEFVRHACQKDGVGEAHFGWNNDSTAAVRRAMALAKVSCLPASFICLFAEHTDDQLMISTVGRVALIVESLSLSTIVFELLRSNSPLMRSVKNADQHTWARHTYKLWASALVIMPAVLAFVSAIGFHYTATRLSTRMAATWGVIALMIGLHAFAMRWLLVVYRRFAIRRSREKRAALQTRQNAMSESGAVAIVPDTSLELRLTDINDQAQSLIRIAATVVGAFLLIIIWHEILPALGYLNRFTFWENGLLPVNEQGERPMVTLVDLFFGSACLAIAILACRNLPGLLDISIFQRLPLDAGARYAASALTQYALVVIGVAVCFRQIGIGWQSIQWLVAAMTVGLGFGLQEIFANFVSGIILLFERPIRVGDTVTIGNVSGTVTRIRIRATTVLDWDNKELIVPNRDFVTGNLVNWTLSNPNLRLVINVGIAFGSDTRLATRLLYEIARSNPLTLPEPDPVVVFAKFGTSSLEFELRVFASGLGNYRTLRHELHLAIDDAFRENNIEIAFPQQDLHVRSIPDSWIEKPATHSSTKTSAALECPNEEALRANMSQSRKHVA